MFGHLRVKDPKENSGIMVGGKRVPSHGMVMMVMVMVMMMVMMVMVMMMVMVVVVTMVVTVIIKVVTGIRITDLSS